MAIRSPDIVKDLYWNRGYNVKEIANKLHVSTWLLYDIMEKNDIPRRSRSDVSFLFHKDKPRFQLKELVRVSDRELKVAGIMLYWAEGTLKGSTVDFANSDPKMIKIFLKFLRDICGVSEDRLRIYVYAYSYSSIDKIKEYWHNITKVPLDQFTKPYIREGNPNLSGRKLPNGMIHVRYNDKKLLETIGGWIREYAEKLR
jgi:hypothetical protein